MRHTLTLFGSIIIVALFCISAGVQFEFEHSPTGGAVIDQNGPLQTRAVPLEDHVNTFFGITDVLFPQHACAIVAERMYEDITSRPPDVTNGFRTQGPERVSTTNFVTDRYRRYGTIDLVHGQALLENNDADSAISLNTETSVQVPKAARANFFSMDMYGITTQQHFIVTKARYSTPSLDCAFLTYNGNVECNCNHHPIANIEVAGITAVIPTKDYFEEVIQEVRETRLHPQYNSNI